MRHLPFLLLALGLLTSAAPARRAPREAALPALERVDTLLASGRAGPARVLLDSLESAARATGDQRLLVAVLTSRGAALSLANRTREAAPVLLEAERLARARGDSLALSHVVRWSAMAGLADGTPAAARARYEEALGLARRTGDRADEAAARAGLAYLDLQAGRPDAARAGYRRAGALFDAVGDVRGAVVARIGLGRVASATGDFETARAAWTRAAADARRTGASVLEAQAVNNLGALEFNVGDPARAVDHYRRAVELHELAGDARGALTPTLNLATAETHLGHNARAEAVLETALTACLAHRWTEERADVLIQLGNVRRQRRALQDAEALHRRVLAMRDSVPPAATRYAVMGLVATLTLTGRHAEAIALLERTLRDAGARVSTDDALRLRLALGQERLAVGRAEAALGDLQAVAREGAEHGTPLLRLNALTATGACWEALGRPDSALASYHAAGAVWETARGLARDPEWREAWGDDVRRLFTAWAALALDQPREVPAASRARAAFDLVQRFKARTLLERMVGPGATPAEGAVATARGLQRGVLEPDEVFVDLLAGDRVTLAFALTRGTLRVARLPRADSLTTRVIDDLMLVGSPPAAASADAERVATRAGTALGGLLLGPFADLLRGARGVIIASDTRLNQVPFASFAVPGGDGTPLALAERELVEVPSATVWAEARRHARTAPARGAGVVRVIVNDHGPTGGELPGARAEARWLERRFAGVEVLREAARVRRGGLAAAEVVHVAGHTAVDDDRPWRSGLLLADGSWLRAADIAALRLDARLAVLSGCESAGGTASDGGGLAGVSAAFLAAGVPSVVGARWPVDDRVTGAFMRAFYERLAAGRSAAGALRDARLALRRDPATRHPFFWAGFVLQGEGRTRVALRDRSPAGLR